MPTTHPDYDQATTGTTVCHAFADRIQGRTFLITGCTPSGIGFATARALAAHAPKLLILASRTNAVLDEAIAELKAAYPDVQTRALLLDLASLSAVRDAAREVNSYPETIDVLVNNAGVMAIPDRRLTADGLELHFGTNHVGHFLFTNLILGNLRAAATGSTPGATRIVNLTSFGHRFGPVRFHDYNFDGRAVPAEEEPDWDLLAFVGQPRQPGYDQWAAYGQSKSANILFSVCLTRRLASEGVLSYAVHPGSIWGTGLAKNMTPETLEKLGPIAQGQFRKSADQGASTTLVAALDPGLTARDGPFLEDCQVGAAKAWATDPDIAERLWGLSEEIVGEKFDV